MEERYHRQIILKNFGEAAQQKLLHAKVLVIGAGGLGCPALQYLAGAGAGTIGIADNDAVSLSNLHRQILFSVQDIGKNKAFIAKEKLRQLNPEITIHAIAEKINTDNALRIIADYDYILDGTDNFSSRYLINDACVLLNKPLIYGAVSQYEGQVAVFNIADKDGIKVNYRDIFQQKPKEGEILNCAEAGVLGVLPAIIGTIQATEIIKLIAEIGQPLINQLLTYNILTQEIFTLDILKNPASPQYLPKDEAAFKSMRYEYFCNTNIHEIDIKEFETLLDKAAIVDVREYGEMPEITAFESVRIPLSELGNRMDEIKKDTVIFICRSGIRSKKAAEIFGQKNKDKQLFSLKGGVGTMRQFVTNH